MGVGSGRSRVAELTFQVFNRALHPEWLTTREFRRVESGGWKADVRITDGGHAVIFQSGLIRLTEILAGPETVLPAPGVLFRTHLGHEKSTILRPGGDVVYQSCLEVEHVDLHVFRHLCEEMTRDASHDRLFRHFRSSNRLAPLPISSVAISSRVRDLSVHSFHTFPDECAIVRTQSLFEIKAAARQR